jgi:hypothetical protein
MTSWSLARPLFAAIVLLGLAACRDLQTIPTAVGAGPLPSASTDGTRDSSAETPRDPAEDGAAVVPDGATRAAPEAGAAGDAEAPPEASTDGAPRDAAEDARPIGPFQVPFLPSRLAYVVLPSSATKPHRLIAGLHGVCITPSYSCGTWMHAAAELGLLVCPTGNQMCVDVPGAPTWEEPFAKIDEDLETAIAKVSARYPGEVSREGAVLTGYSRGAYAAAIIAARHPGRWPFLVLNEADTELSLPMLRAGKVRAVALIAGEWGSQIAGERKNVDELTSQGYPIRLWVMPKAGHAYSSNIEAIMREALEFVLSHEHDG